LSFFLGFSYFLETAFQLDFEGFTSEEDSLFYCFVYCFGFVVPLTARVFALGFGFSSSDEVPLLEVPELDDEDVFFLCDFGFAGSLNFF
jgi:hypothetical protein